MSNHNKKKILFTFRNKYESDIEFISADTEIEAWQILEKKVGTVMGKIRKALADKKERKRR